MLKLAGTSFSTSQVPCFLGLRFISLSRWNAYGTLGGWCSVGLGRWSCKTWYVLKKKRLFHLTASLVIWWDIAFNTENNISFNTKTFWHCSEFMCHFDFCLLHYLSLMFWTLMTVSSRLPCLSGNSCPWLLRNCHCVDHFLFLFVSELISEYQNS